MQHYSSRSHSPTSSLVRSDSRDSLLSQTSYASDNISSYTSKLTNIRNNFFNSKASILEIIVAVLTFNRSYGEVLERQFREIEEGFREVEKLEISINVKTKNIISLENRLGKLTNEITKIKSQNLSSEIIEKDRLINSLNEKIELLEKSKLENQNLNQDIGKYKNLVTELERKIFNLKNDVVHQWEAESYSNNLRNKISSVGKNIPIIGQGTALAGGIVGGVSNTVIGTAGAVTTSVKESCVIQ